MAGTFYEAASVCFDRHHQNPIAVHVQGAGQNYQTSIDWEPPDARIRRCYANNIDTTECGAYGVSLAALEEKEGLVAVHRAETLSGADYYVAQLPADDPDDLESAIRLEVSGTDQGNYSACHSRMNKKIAQTRASNHSHPAIASIVGFRERLVLVSDLIDP